MVKKFQNYNGCVSIFGMLDVGQKLTLERHSYRARFLIDCPNDCQNRSIIISLDCFLKK